MTERAAAMGDTVEDTVAEPSWKRRLAVDEESPTTRPATIGALVVLVLSLLWLAGTLRAAGAAVANNGGDAAVAISTAAQTLPTIVAAVLIVGLAVGLAIAVRFGGARRRRLIFGGTGGAVIGVATGALVLVMFGANGTITAIAVTIVVAGALGGLAAGLPTPVLNAGLIATLAVFLFSTVLNLFRAPLMDALGAGDTAASVLGAAERLLLGTALLNGLLAGLSAYLVLRRQGSGLRWPWYLLAGAAAGLLLLVVEALTRIGGSGLLGIVSGFSSADSAALTYLASGRLKSALIVGFTGGICAMIAVGRTLKSPDAT